MVFRLYSSFLVRKGQVPIIITSILGFLSSGTDYNRLHFVSVTNSLPLYFGVGFMFVFKALFTSGNGSLYRYLKFTLALLRLFYVMLI